MSLGIYLHIPFCKQKCLYCDFNSYAGQENLMDEYCDALKREILSYSVGESVDTIYFGGGTPTLLGAERLADVLETLVSHFKVITDCEITAECNPGTIDAEGLSRLYSAGFNRLSIGLQSTDDAMIKRLGRIHSYQEFLECFQNAKRVGFANLSLDLMYGLPHQTREEWRGVLRTALKCNPKHLSCYGLKIEEGTPFATMELALPSDDTMREMYDDCVEILREAGYERYEISNFAKPGYESRHNLKYWNYENFIGFGAGAYSCKDGERWSNFSGIAEYCRAVREKNSAIEEKVLLTREEQMSEFCFLGLRTEKGIGQDKFKKQFGQEITDVFGKILFKNLERKTMIYHEGRYRLAPEFFYVSNGVLADFV